MIRSLSAALLLSAACLSAQAQSLYMPRDIQQAFKKETRSPDGRPGKKYWQNTARYSIKVQALPPDRNIKGSEQITYFNNSPDTLKRIVIRVIQNIHKPGVTRNGDASEQYLTSGLQVDTFTVAGKTLPFPNNTGQATWKTISLPKPLMPHDSVRMSVAWHFPLSVESGREGMIDKTTFFLAYFYPRVSVYDDYNGWDRLDFTDAQEFYNDFNNYTLQVKVPANYVVWSTGTLLNPQEVLQAPFAQRLAQSMTSDAVMHIATADDLAKHRVTAQQKVNIWKWRANNISDMTVGLSDHYVWDAASVVVDDATKRRASVQAAYADSTVDFRQAVKNAQYSLGWFSRNWPGVPYPFEKMTVFQGFADMEYPMMVNDSPQSDLGFAQLVEDHEIAHTWFPFYMGINESRYAFMDEGWATTWELLIGRTEKSVEAADKFYKQFRVNGWIHDPSSSQDLPIITPASELRRGYGNNAYGKPSLSYLALKDMLGDELFKKSLHEYMDRWHGKHPIPWDFFNSFTSASGQDLNWFFNNWFFTNNYIDLAVEKVGKAKKGQGITINNIGGFAVPFDVKVTYADGSNEVLHQSPAIWRADQRHATVVVPTKKTIQSVELTGGIFMDADEKNNKWTPGKQITQVIR
ncbi:M1 family metallopeptidase [Hymenobacter jejuensis]|uniref:M1 family metallopeptidase n=1 Tax=Hymenobacter jejuensis TaxID=2502781 RepID=A0A5B7ZZC4_9BACT|nr:M1 family metallopeptidase [Hymenobacter jejuensis]QDA60571.1 M1 family metallopeptidase [Hymenobacter jejuensis]